MLPHSAVLNNSLASNVIAGKVYELVDNALHCFPNKSSCGFRISGREVPSPGMATFRNICMSKRTRPLGGVPSVPP